MSRESTSAGDETAAAETLQEWGVESRSRDRIEASIVGEYPNDSGKNAVWGWRKIASVAGRGLASNPKLEETFFKAWLNVAKSRYLAGTLVSGPGRDAQFRKAVKVLDGLKAQDAAGIITALIESGEDGLMSGEGGPEGADDAADEPGLRLGGVDRAVSYVNAMQERSRLKLMAELSADRPELAADLLERLRSRGVAAAQTP